MTSDLVGLYVHIPFCSVKCFYCDFTAVAHHGHLVERYLRALAAESKQKSRPKPDTVYVGGGTPSELSAPQIRELFSILRSAYPGLSPIETTFEANPESIDEEKLVALRDAGVTRLSIGLQTADPVLMKGIGRRHTLDQFVAAYQAARRVGGFAISVDLMYNLPGQSVQSCLDSLEFVLKLQPEHLSLYGLQVEDQTLFGKRGITPDEDEGREMFERSLDRIAEAGFHHYEISNFAQPGHEAKHNLIYWKNGEYVGLGAGAAQFLGGVRSTNLDRLMPYMEAAEAGEDPVEETERLMGLQKLGENWILGLRLMDGFKPSREMTAAFAAELIGLEGKGLIRRTEDVYALTRNGLFVANDVFREFVLVHPSAEVANQ